MISVKGKEMQYLIEGTEGNSTHRTGIIRTKPFVLIN